MPFCRKCGRRLPEESESCTDCGTSTTASIIKIKKASSPRLFKDAASPKVAKASIPASKSIVSVKVIPETPKKPAKAAAPVKAAVATPKPVLPPKPVTPAVVYPPHEIIKSNVSIKQDIISNPHDYETETFGYDLKCANGHFWREGRELPVSKGKAYCPQCGEQLRKPKRRNRRQRYEGY